MGSQIHLQTDDEAMKLTSFEENFHKDAEDAAADKHGGGGGGVLRPSRLCHLAVLSTAFWAFVFFLHYAGTQGVLFKQSAFSLPPLLSGNTVGGHGPSPRAQPPPPSVLAVQEHSPPLVQAAAAREDRHATAPPADDRCVGRYIYMYDLPARFNEDLVRDCKHLWRFYDMCPLLANSGMGRPLGDEGGVFSPRGWYATNQFTLDVIFHVRMMRSYDCLTNNPSLATALYVPFYASLDGGRHMWNGTALRDALALDLVDWLAQRPEWRAMGGRDHFMVAGRTAWDFRRYDDVDEQWGTKLLNNPAVQNMTVLVLETSPWRRANFAVPYPTYFHPEAAAEVVAWQEKVRGAERSWLFAFVGAPHPWKRETVRPEIFRQCDASSRCRLFRCGRKRSATDCESPGAVMRVFEGSEFCLQPRGDSLTRRSTFDAILAGCIPVFFHPGSAYTQYALHLPKEPESWSVLIMHTDVSERNVSIQERLARIPPETVRAMREEVIRLIPRVVYANPTSRRVDFKDAFDVAVEAVIDRVAKRRRGDAEAR
ncbi:unnamed protein product [Urochloa humidicola]